VEIASKSWARRPAESRLRAAAVAGLLHLGETPIGLPTACRRESGYGQELPDPRRIALQSLELLTATTHLPWLVSRGEKTCGHAAFTPTIFEIGSGNMRASKQDGFGADIVTESFRWRDQAFRTLMF